MGCQFVGTIQPDFNIWTESTTPYTGGLAPSLNIPIATNSCELGYLGSVSFRPNPVVPICASGLTNMISNGGYETVGPTDTEGLFYLAAD